MDVDFASPSLAKTMLDHFHPLRSGGCLKGAKFIIAGYENQIPVFVAVFVSPRSRWKNYDVRLNLSRLAWSPTAKHSATTFLRRSIRLLKQHGCDDGLIVTYAMPGTSGMLYERAGFYNCGYSSGCSWGHRGKNERATPNTIGYKIKLKRYFFSLKRNK